MTRPEPFDGSAFLPPGVKHVPGMAQELMDELAPLLAAEGIDLKNPPEDLDVFNAALRSASERRNMELFIPVGEERVRALVLVFSAIKQVAMGDEGTGIAVLSAAVPQATDTAPSVGHVCGVTWAMLDSVLSNRLAADALEGFVIPAGEEALRVAAAHTLIEARHGGATTSTAALIGLHNGANAMVGAVLALAGVLITAAKRLDTSVTELMRGELGRGEAGELAAALARLETPEPSAGGRQRRKAHKKERRTEASTVRRADARLFNNAVAWYSRHEADDTEDVQMYSFGLEAALAVARGAGLDPHSPTDVCALATFVALLPPGDDDEAAGAEHLILLGSIPRYANYRVDQSQDDPEWQAALRRCIGIVEGSSAESDAGYHHASWPEPVGDLEGLVHRMVLAESEPERERRLAAELILPAVSGIPRVVEWVGKGRPVTSTGGVRRADIAALGGFLGLDVVGVASPSLSTEGPRELTSMWDHPLLENWWTTLLEMGILETSSTRVKPGEKAGHPLAPEEIEQFVRVMVAATILPSPEVLEPSEGYTAWVVINALTEAIERGAEAVLPTGLGFGAEVYAGPALRGLADLGVANVTRDKRGTRVSVPADLRLPVAAGARYVVRVLQDAHELG